MARYDEVDLWILNEDSNTKRVILGAQIYEVLPKNMSVYVYAHQFDQIADYQKELGGNYLVYEIHRRNLHRGDKYLEERLMLRAKELSGIMDLSDPPNHPPIITLRELEVNKYG